GGGGRRDRRAHAARHRQRRGACGLRRCGPAATGGLLAAGPLRPDRRHRSSDGRQPSRCPDALLSAARTPHEENMSRLLAAFLFALVLGSTTGAAHEQTEKRNGVIAQLRAESVPPSSGSADSKMEVSLSGELVLTLTIDAPRGVEVAPLPAIA